MAGNAENPPTSPELPFPTKSPPTVRTNRYTALFDTLRLGHPHAAGKLAEETITLCLDTVWKAAKLDRSGMADALNDELMRACLQGLTPVSEVVDAVTENPDIRSSRGVCEGYLNIGAKVDMLFQHIKTCWPDRTAAWKSLRDDVGDLLDSLHFKRASADQTEVDRCRSQLLLDASLAG